VAAQIDKKSVTARIDIISVAAQTGSKQLTAQTKNSGGSCYFLKRFSWQ
jgi:hypothetical protein